MPERKVRFGVGSANGPQSAVWNVWTGAATSDVYVACRHLAKSLKVSLHKSGSWRLAFTERYATTAGVHLPGEGDRASVKWTRPVEFQAGWTHALDVIIPASELWEPDPPLRLPAEVNWRRPPGSGQESHFGLFLERASGLTARRPAGDTIWSAYLPSGENVWVIAADVSSAPENVAAYERSRTDLRRVPGGADHGSRGFVFGDRPDGTRVAIDLYTGSRSAAGTGR